jgi:hypothetical protein
VSTILSGLVELWRMSAPASGLASVATGSVRGTALNLLRAHRDSGTVLDPELGWTAEPLGRDSYNGGGVATLPEAPAGGSVEPGAPIPGSYLPPLDEAGQAVTLAVRWWAEAGAAAGVQGPPDTDGPLEHEQQVLGLSGWHDNAGGGTYEGTALVVTSADGSLPGTVGYRQSSAGSPTEVAAGVVPAVSCIAAVLVREASVVRLRVYVDGGIVGDTDGYELDPDELVPTRVVFGSVRLSGGGVTQAAVWRRALTADELLALGGSLNGVAAAIGETAGPGSPNPLLTPAGLSAITVARIRRMDARGVLASGGDGDGPGGGRHTRLGHDRAPRVYELTLSEMDRSDADLVREALRATRGGAGVTRWRHPVDDDPPSVGDPVGGAPRWRILNGSAWSASRRRGGALGETVLVLEEVVDQAVRAVNVPDGPGGGGTVSFDNHIGGGALGVDIRIEADEGGGSIT